MKVSKKEHKAILHGLFFKEENQMGRIIMKQINFPLQELADAGSAFKKLIESVDEDDKKFLDSDIIFDLPETVVLKNLFDKKREWPVGDAEFVYELKELFNKKN